MTVTEAHGSPCPFCAAPLQQSGTVFVEEGEWDGKEYADDDRKAAAPRSTT